jgi:hypothetical protein
MKVANLNELRVRVTDVAASVPPQMLKNTWRGREYNLEVLRIKVVLIQSGSFKHSELFYVCLFFRL